MDGTLATHDLLEEARDGQIDLAIGVEIASGNAARPTADAIARDRAEPTSTIA